MSTTPPANPTASIPTVYPEPTEADGDAMFASVVWFDTQQSCGALGKYEGKYVAVLEQKILDADISEEELFRRLDSLGDAIPPNRLVVRYVPRLEELTC